MPSVLTTDQGKEFDNKVNSDLMRVFGIKHRLTTAYHPQANGLDERFNQTLANSLAKFAQVNRDSLDERLGAVVYAYSSALQVCFPCFTFTTVNLAMLFVITNLNLLPQMYFRSPQNTPHSRLCLDEEHSCQLT